MVCRLTFGMLMLMLLLTVLFVQCEEAENEGGDHFHTSLHVLGESEDYVFVLSEVRGYRFYSELVSAFKTEDLPGFNMKPVKSSELPFSSDDCSFSVLYDSLLICSGEVWVFNPESGLRKHVELSKIALECGKVALDSTSRLVALRSSELLVYDSSGAIVLSKAISTTSENARLFVTGKNSIAVYDDVTSTIQVHNYDLSERSTYKGISSAKMLGGGLVKVELGEENVAFKAVAKRGKSVVLNLHDGKLLAFSDSCALSEPKMKATYETAWPSACMKRDSTTLFFNEGQIVFEQSPPLTSRYCITNAGYIRDRMYAEALCDVASGFLVCFDDCSKSYSSFRLANSKGPSSFPSSTVFSTALDAPTDRLSVLYTNREWVSVDVDQWEVAKRIQIPQEWGALISAEPVSGAIAVHAENGVYAVDHEGVCHTLIGSSDENVNFLFQQNGSLMLEVRQEDKRMFFSKYVHETVFTVTLFDVSGPLNDKGNIVKLAEVESLKFDRSPADNLCWWKVANFAGKEGLVLVRNGKGQVNVLHGEGKSLKYPKDNDIHSMVWPSGTIACSGSFFNVRTGAKEGAYYLTWPPSHSSVGFVSAFSFAETDTDIFVKYSSSKTGYAPEVYTSVHHNAEDTLLQCKQFVPPKGTSWFVYHKSKLLCISRYGELLGSVIAEELR